MCSSKVGFPLDGDNEDSDVGDEDSVESCGVVIVDRVMVFVRGRATKRPWTLGCALQASVTDDDCLR